MRTPLATLLVLSFLAACGSGSSAPGGNGDDAQVVTDDDRGGDAGDTDAGDAADADGDDDAGDALPGDGGDEVPGDGDGTPTVCTPGATLDCYDGPSVTLGVGACVGGTKTCSVAGDGYGACSGQVVPVDEICSNGIDDDCNGITDDSLDVDGDGWTRCEGDCCDTEAECAHPTQVNPGAFELNGNGVDDDCDPATVTSDTCDTALASNPTSTTDYARALDLCAFTTQSPAQPSQRKWGVISAQLKRASGSGTPAVVSSAIRSSFGGTLPQLGSSFVVLSTGSAAASGQTDPASVAPQPGLDNGVSSTPPADWLAANGNSIALAPGCPHPATATVYDPVMLELKVRVPTNAGGFSARFNFFTSEYPEWVCSQYNDVFVALLDSIAAGNPADKNLAAFTTPGNARYLVSPSLASGNPGYFTQCTNGATGCGSGAVAGSATTCVGTDGLVGTGFDTVATGCGTNNLAGGATGWWTIEGNVVPGEVATLRFVIWDTTDGTLDSTVVLDGFEWIAL